MKILSKSQKRHLKKVQKRKEKTQERRNKQLFEQQNSHKLIEENHNGNYYSLEFTQKARDRFLKDLFEYPGESYLLYIRRMRSKYQTLLLKWSPELPRDSGFYILKDILDIYYENKDNSEKPLKDFIHEKRTTKSL